MNLAALSNAIAPRLATIAALVAKGAVTSLTFDAGDGAGKKAPAKAKSALALEEKCDCGAAKAEAQTQCKCSDVAKTIDVDIAKASDEKQIVVGIVLQPETVDAQGDIYSAAVIEEAAHNFLANYGTKTKLGFQHKEFKAGRFALVESYIATSDTAIGDRTVKAGSWIMSVKVLDAAVWKQIKAGKVKGFSIGGKARVQRLKPEASPLAVSVV